MLLVFDNCEHLLDVCGSVISQLMAVSPKSAVLATSREPLGLAGEAVFRVPSLSLPSAGGGTADLLQSDAGRLFVERAALVRPGFAPTDDDAAAITEICTRLDGIPLAIELAAARVRMLGPADIAHRLDDRFRLLTGGSRSALPRQQTLQATVDWSFRLLSPAEQTMLTRLAVFQGGCDLQSAERVCADDGMDALDVLDVVSSLQDKSLVIEIDSAVQRFRMTETIRQYASERLLDTTDVEALRDRHAHHFAGRTNAAIANSVAHAFSDLTQLCHADADNLRAAATWLLQREPAAALHLLCELNIAAMFWHDMAWVATLTPLALEQAVDASVDMRAVGHVNVAGSALFGYVDADVRQHQVAARSLLDSMQDRGDFGYVLAMLNFQSSATARRGMDRDAARLAMQAADEGGSVIRRFAVGMITLLLAPFTVAEPIIASFIDDARRLSEPLLEQQWSLEMAVHLGFAGRSEAGLIMLRAGLLDLDHLTSNGDAFQSALFAAILEGEHGDVAIGTNLAADLAERLERRPHDPCEETMARAAVARLAVLSGDFETAERVAARAADRMRDGQPPSFLTSLVDVTLSQCLRRRGELDQAARALGRDLNGTATGSTDIWLRMLEEAALLFHAFGRTSNAADLLATATVGRLEVGKPLAPAGRADLDHLRADLGAVPGVVLDNAAAARLIESLAVD